MAQEPRGLANDDPTEIYTVEDHRTMNEVLVALINEAKRRGLYDQILIENPGVKRLEQLGSPTEPKTPMLRGG